jgi:glycosyltransferase involved in cell wall biosynthesis
MEADTIKSLVRVDRPLRLTVISGYWEYHHNQLVFFNYLERMAGTGFATYKSLLEYDARVAQIDDSDLVIFTRCRSANALDLMRYCMLNSIQTLYFIDDNWFTVATDMPGYGYFKPGNENYDNFVLALGLSNTVMTPSDYLADYIRPYTNSTIVFKPGLEPHLFKAQDARDKTEELLIGFAGSIRYDDNAFKALRDVAIDHKEIKLLIAGHISEEQRGILACVNYINLPFQSYPVYAHTMANLRPDLLMAPLADNPTNNSKYFNKYLESSIVGAATVASKVVPYTEVIHDKINGFFVQDETAIGWRNTIEEAIDDVPKLRLVQERAYRDVIDNHSVDSNLQGFTNLIQSLVCGDTI